jgi:hypothetical protein
LGEVLLRLGCVGLSFDEVAVFVLIAFGNGGDIALLLFLLLVVLVDGDIAQPQSGGPFFLILIFLL